MKQFRLSENDAYLLLQCVREIKEYAEGEQWHNLVLYHCFHHEEKSVPCAIRDAHIVLLNRLLEASRFRDPSYCERANRLLWAFNFGIRDYQLTKEPSRRSFLCDSRYDRQFRESKRPFRVTVVSKEEIVFDCPDDVYLLVWETHNVIEMVLRWDVDELFSFASIRCACLDENEFYRLANPLSKFKREASDYYAKCLKIMEGLL